ncbi:MAG: hypothetical protein AABZ60_18315 [Planctomycetota bacterium]
MRALVFIFLGLMLSLVAQTPPAHKLNISVNYQFLGIGWNPILVEIENPETTLFEGEIRISNQIRKAGVTYKLENQSEIFRQFQIPSQTKKRFWMYLPLTFNRFTPELFWKIQAKGAEKVLFQGTLLIPYQTLNDFQILTFSSEKTLLNHLHQQISLYVNIIYNSIYSSYAQTTIKVFQYGPDILPDRREGYNPLYLVVLNQFPLEGDMSVPQINALKEWIAEGGSVLLSPGSESWIQSSLVQELFPVTLEKTEAKTPEELNEQGFSLHQLDPLVGEAKKATYIYYHLKYPEKTKFFDATEEDAKNSETSSHLGYLACYPYCRGWVYMVPFDMSRYPLKTWGKNFYDKYLFKDCYAPKYVEDVDKKLYDYTAPEKKISLLNFFFVLSVYLLLMGPIQYYLLYRWKIRSYLLLSVTLVSLLCVLLVFIYGYYFYGNQDQYQLYTFISGEPKHQIETALLNISSTTNKIYSISGDPKTSIQMLFPSEYTREVAQYNETDGNMELQIPIGLWNNRCFQLKTHDISSTLQYPLEVKKTENSLQIQALEDIDGFFIYNNLFQIIYARDEKFSSKDGSLKVALSPKKMIPENKELHKIRIHLGEKFYPLGKGFILIRYPKPRHQLRLNGNPIQPQKNQTFFIQPF